MRIAIVEDDSILREGLKMLLAGEPGVTVSGAYASAEEAISGLKKGVPDVMLTDLGLPGMSGVEMIKSIKAETPDVEILAHTIFEDKENVFSAIKAGASGYLLKGSSAREIIEALHCIYNGGAPMSPKIARKIIMEFQDEGVNEQQYILSHREKEILREIERGLSYKEIAGKAAISPHTVHTHIKKIYEKLHAKDRQEALLTARKKGII